MFKRVLNGVVLISLISGPSLILTARAEDSLPDLISPDELGLELNSQNDSVGSEPLESGSGVIETLSPLEEKSILPTEEDLNRAEIVIVVNKAERGTHAQSVRIYRGGSEIYEFSVSTGREKWEHAKSGREYFSETPIGYFRPTKLVEKYWSVTWQAWMQNAVFFDNGIALHATTKNHYTELGRRASGGCVRLTLENSEVVYDLVKNLGKRPVPAIGRNGKPVLDNQGNPVLVNNYDALVIVYDHQD